MNSNFKLRSGKYAGKTIEWLRDNDLRYLLWVEENRPEMLKEHKTEKQPTKKNIEYTKETLSSLQPNYNFYNEGPAEISKPYLKKQQELENKENGNSKKDGI